MFPNQIDKQIPRWQRTYLDTTIGVNYREMCCLYMTTERRVVQSVPAKGVAFPQVHAVSEILHVIKHVRTDSKNALLFHYFKLFDFAP